jgi:GT2 family glycosyltransferase
MKNKICKNLPKTYIIMLNWNGWKDTIECLESLYRITYPNFNVILIDNDSQDKSVNMIKKYCKGEIDVQSKFFKYDSSNKPIEIIEYTRKKTETEVKKESEHKVRNRRMILIMNEKNYGFAEGNNIGIRYILNSLKPGYILLLNNDTIVNKNFLTEMVKIAESDKKIGIVGPKIYYYNYAGRSDVINFAGADITLWKGTEKRYDWNKVDRGKFENPREVDKIEGSCMLIKRRVIEDIGLFDSKFFTYWEDTDFCIRASKKGYKLVYSPNSKIWHKIAVSSKGRWSSSHTYYTTRNMFLFIKKHVKKFDLIMFFLYYFLYIFWFKFGYFVYHQNIRGFISLLKGVKDGLIMAFLSSIVIS